MDREFLCIECNVEFNSSDHMPHMLPKCGHTICSACLTHLLTLPQFVVCKEDQYRCVVYQVRIECDMENDIRNFPFNQSMLKLVQRKGRQSSRCQTEFNSLIETPSRRNSHHEEHQLQESQSYEQLEKSNFCMQHQKHNELICMDDGQYICVTCGLFGAHKNHNFQTIEQFDSQLDLAFNEVTAVYRQVKSQFDELEQSHNMNQISNSLAECKNKALVQIQQQFQDMIAQIHQVEQDVLKDIDVNFYRMQSKNVKRIESILKQTQLEAQQWLSQTSEKLTAFDDIQVGCGHLQQRVLELGSGRAQKSICKQGQEINQKFNTTRIQISETLQTIQNEIVMQIPVQLFINHLRSSVGREEHNEQNEISLVDERHQMSVSDIFLQQTPQQVEKYELPQSQSQQPTQPTSPSYCMMKKESYFPSAEQQPVTTPQINQMKLRSHTIHVDAECEAFNQSCLTARGKNRTVVKKFTKDPKMNDKIGNCLSLIYADNQDIVEMSQIDFSPELSVVVCEYLRGKHNIKVLKCNRCKITDESFQTLFSCLDSTQIHTLHLQQNVLTEKSIDFLICQFKQRKQQHDDSLKLKSIYLNQNSFPAIKVKRKLEELKKQGLQVSV